MKYCFCFIMLVLSNIVVFSQLSYTEIGDLYTLCKKEDFEASKTFLLNKGYIITSDKGRYDHGSYYVYADINAKRKIGNRNDFLLKGTDSENMYDVITIRLKEYDEYKELEIEQKISTNELFCFVIKSVRNETINNLKYENWTKLILDNTYSLGSRSPDATTNYILPKLDGEKIRLAIKNFKLDEKENFSVYFLNDNEVYGDLKNISIYYDHKQSTDRNYDPFLKIDSVTTHFYNYSFFLRTKIVKGKNINSSSNIISIPLIKKGNHFYVKIKFGNLVKTYVLDSGASDMSVDDETYEYFKKTNQLKSQNRLSTGKYQLADGTIVEFKKIKVPFFTIDKIQSHDIDATIVQNGKPLLLGKSFLDSFKSWKIDNKNQMLTLELF